MSFGHLTLRELPHYKVSTLSSTLQCDPILPNTPDDQALAQTFRNRLEQCLDTLNKCKFQRKIYIFIDAIDNAEFVAKQNNQQTFSKILLESFHTRPIVGVKLIVSCRTERKPDTHAKYSQLELKPFSKGETTAFLKAREAKGLSSLFTDTAYSRSGGNARVLEYLIQSKGQLGCKDKSKLHLDDLLTVKIEKAIEIAAQRGTSEDDLTTFLSGLTLLAPPVSIKDYALANQVDSNAITSMISDLAPLLELSKYGVMFKDEPTETLIINKYGTKIDDLKKIASNLLKIQDQSVFAAKTLPDLLYKLGDSDRIYSLASDGRIPSSIESDVGKLRIRYARLQVAAKYAAENKDFDKLIGFLVEISIIVESDQRGLTYLLDHPELVVELNDSNAIRRIYEAQTEWPGTWYARLVLIHTLRGDLEEAHGHVHSLHEWVDHYLRMDQNSRHKLKSNMQAIDCVAEPLFMLAKRSPEDAAKYFSDWKDWFSFRIASQLYHYLPLAMERGVISKEDISTYYGELDSIGAIVATLHFCNISKVKKTYLLKKLVTLLNKKNDELPDILDTSRDFLFRKCFLYASLDSFRENKKSAAKTIIDTLGKKRPKVYAFTDRYYHNNFPEFLIREVLRSIILNREITYFDILPDELHCFGKKIRDKKDKEGFLKKLKFKINTYLESEEDDTNKIIRRSDKEEIEDVLNNRLPQLYSLAVAVRHLLSSSGQKSKHHLNSLIEIWENISNSDKYYHTNKIDYLWLQFGYELIIFSLFTLRNIKAKDLDKLLASERLNSLSLNSNMALIQAVSVLLPGIDLAEKIANKLSKKIQLENDVSTRSDYFSEIAECLLMVNKDEALEYFKNGLLAVDAIGSGDYRYVNELLIFTASLHGKELEPSGFHPLNNICELNMGEEPHKFYWESYSAAFSKIAGLRGLAQLSRWDDRQKISLSYTLLPSLIALVRDKKISSKDAIALNYLAAPVECHDAGTSEFSEVLSVAKLTELEVRELINQFFLNNSSISMSSTVKSLADISEKVLGKKSQETTELQKIYPTYEALIDKSNRHSSMNSSMGTDKFKKQQDKKKKEREKTLFKQISKANPSDKVSFRLLIKSLNKQNYAYEFKDQFFIRVRKKIDYKKRKSYIENLASLDNEDCNWYWVLDELSKCYEAWGKTSISLKKVFKEAGIMLLHQNFMHLVKQDYLSKSNLDKISDFSGISVSDLALELIKVGTQYNSIPSGAVWLSLATLLNEKSSDNIGQQALTNLLDGEATSLGELASDGQYKPELYPDNNTNKIIANLIWKVLGSYDAKERWRAAHSIRCFAKFSRWDVISEVVSLISTENAGAFQCTEIKFYDYHARLWLLISLARIAKDYPQKVSQYKLQILPFTKGNHVLFRHFASKVLLDCYFADKSLLSGDELSRLQEINTTPRPLIEESSRRTNSYVGRPKGTPEASHQFYFEYDFRKMKIDTLGDVFNIDCWKMDDLIAESAYEIDSEVTDHTDKGNKPLYSSHNRSTSHEHSYGDHIAWHALHITAGKLLATHSVAKGYWKENSWDDFLSHYTLTRKDGFWKSDSLDMIPLEIKKILRKEKKGKLVLPENKNVLLDLINIKNKIGKDIIVDGYWNSKDGINVNISSALVQKKYSKKAIAALSKETPFQVCLPDLEGDDECDRFETQNRHNLLPWIVSTEECKKLDEFDPYSADTTSLRSKISGAITELYGLNCTDQFKKIWNDKNGKRILKSEMWKGPTRDRHEEECSGNRLTCSSNFLKKLLKDCGANLIILIRLQQYIERDYGSSSGKFFHSIGIIEINEKLEFKFRKGCNIEKKNIDD